MKKIIIILVLPIFLISCATNSIDEVTDPKAREIMSHPVQEIQVEGVGKVTVGDVLIHKAMGKGVAKALYINDDLNWVAFV